MLGNDVLTRQFLGAHGTSHFSLQVARNHVSSDAALLHYFPTSSPVASRLSSIRATELMACVQVAVHMGSGGQHHDVTGNATLRP